MADPVSKIPAATDRNRLEMLNRHASDLTGLAVDLINDGEDHCARQVLHLRKKLNRLMQDLQRNGVADRKLRA